MLMAHRARRCMQLLALAWVSWTPAAVALSAGASEPPPSRLRLERLSGPLVPGQHATLRIETVDQAGKPLPVPRPIEVSLTGAAGLTSTVRITVPAGSAGVGVPIKASKPGLWQVDARGEGLYSASTVIVCVAPAVLERHQDVARVLQRLPATAPGAAAERPRARARVPALPSAPASAPAQPLATAPAPAPAQPFAATPAPAPASPPRHLIRAPSTIAAPTTPPRAAPTAAFTPAGTATARTEEERLVAERAASPAGQNRGSRLTTIRSSAAPGAERLVTAPATPGGAAASTGTGSGAGTGGSTSPGAGAGTSSGTGAGAAPGTGSGGAATKGGVRLIPEHMERYRGAQGWESVPIDAYWYENGNPSPAPQQIDLELALVNDQGDLRIEPDHLSIPPGDFVTRQPAVVTAASARKASLQALYPHGQSNLVDVSFLAAPAAKLTFASGPQVIHAFGVASSEVYVRLLDAAGVPATANQKIQVNLRLSGPMGSPQLPPVWIDPGQFETRAPVELPRFGTYSVFAAASNLADAPPLSIEVAFDWLLLLATLFGGLLGSLTRVLYQGQKADETPRRLLRVLLLGGLAALLVVLLSAFGLLSLIAGALPQSWSEALARIPLGSLTGVFLLGFLAGLLFDRVLGGVLSPARDRAAAAKATAPAEE
jgi:hypothetical protein